MKQLFLILQLFACCSFVLSNSYLAEFVRAQSRYDAKGTLDLGDACSYADEAKRIAFNKDVHERMSQIESIAAFSIVARSLEKLSDSVPAFCNPKRNVACNEETATCDCIQIVPGLPFNVTATRVNGACKITSGSTCIPPEGGRVDECEAGTSCQLVASRVACRNEAVARAILAANNYPSTDFVDLFRTSYNQLAGGICKCI